MSERAPVIFAIPDGTRVTACSSCQGAICFVVTEKGKRMPLEALNRVVNGKQIRRGESHFAHCPNAAAHRRPK